MTQLEAFRKTVGFEQGCYLWYLSCHVPTDTRLRRELSIPDNVSVRRFLGGFEPLQVSGTYCYPGFDGEPDWRSLYFSDYEVKPGSCWDINGCMHEPGSFEFFSHFVAPLRKAVTLEEVKQFPFKHFDPSIQPADIKERIAEAHAEGRVVSCWVGHMYEDSWQIRDYEQFLEDMVLNPEIPAYILERRAIENLATVEFFVKAGVDVIRTGDDVASQRALMFSEKMWWEFIGSRWAKVWERAKTINPNVKIWYHSDGDISPIAERLCDLGVDILNPVQPECVDSMALRRKLGKRLVFDGLMGTQTTMPFGTPNEVKQRVYEIAEKHGKDGGIIISPTHVLEPEVPTENILAFAEACREVTK